MHQHLLHTRSFAATLWLMAKGHEPAAVELARDGSGAVLFLFPNEAQPDLTAFHEAKDRLNTMSLAARGR